MPAPKQETTGLTDVVKPAGLTTSVKPVVSCFGAGTCQKGEKCGTRKYKINAIGRACASNSAVFESECRNGRLGAKCVAKVDNKMNTKPL